METLPLNITFYLFHIYPGKGIFFIIAERIQIKPNQ